MAKRTFKSFLLAYCCELAQVRTVSIKRLLDLCLNESPRVQEPLFLYAAASDRLQELLKLAQGSKLEEAYFKTAKDLESFENIEAFLMADNCSKRYKSVYEAWLAPADKLAASRRLVALMRPKILTALKSANISRYKLCKDLSLNMGNVYAYLAGDDTKLNWKTAQKLLDYATNL